MGNKERKRVLCTDSDMAMRHVFSAPAFEIVRCRENIWRLVMATKLAKKEEPKNAEKRQPDYVVRCKQSPESEYWLTIGAGWTAAFKDGSSGISVKINNAPMGWNGDCLLMTPKAE
jgi:uncharacterized protein (DUF736 family)